MSYDGGYPGLTLSGTSAGLNIFNQGITQVETDNDIATGDI